ncbi:hypothetical protein NKR23_g5888 [Pleurostoma richardsiae]|uniref:Xylanolytic transcriptional activator regulatory domain-containing protein n=1 Tax=Pleurostoma richardsiae TaxID=41990 RepID=A0AA38RSF5_9PEZI|nr:hypothetical protein NKR23_g5888 [Pleurostoma richardsiae]
MDIHDVLSIISHRQGYEEQISLLLYQAILFASSAFVGLDDLAKAGYQDRKAARRAFFQKTKTLYDVNYESDHVVLVRAILLMSYWQESPDHDKNSSHWVGVAISLAKNIGLHSDLSTNGLLTPRMLKLRRRIWWSCVMRDGKDLDVCILGEDSRLLLPDCVLLRDPEMQQKLNQICVQQAKLCVLINYALKARSREADTVDFKLKTWKAALPTSCQYQSLTKRDALNGCSTIALHLSLIFVATSVLGISVSTGVLPPTSLLRREGGDKNGHGVGSAEFGTLFSKQLGEIYMDAAFAARYLANVVCRGNSQDDRSSHVYGSALDGVAQKPVEERLVNELLPTLKETTPALDDILNVEPQASDPDHERHSWETCPFDEETQTELPQISSPAPSSSRFDTTSGFSGSTALDIDLSVQGLVPWTPQSDVCVADDGRWSDFETENSDNGSDTFLLLLENTETARTPVGSDEDKCDTII